MKKPFTQLQLFSLTDGRLSTSIDDIYDMLNHICDTDLMTHHLPVAFDYLKEKAPNWYLNERANLNALKASLISQKIEPSFENLINELKKNQTPIDIPQLKDEFETSDFGEFMVNNSLLLKKGN